MIYDISRLILEFFLRVFFKMRFFGRENIPDPPYIMVSNHASLLDPPLVGVACNKNRLDFMAKKELFDTPIVGTWVRLVNCICIKRGASNVESLKEALRRIHKKRVVCIFPEGTRSVDGSLQEAKRGTGFLIVKAGVPVIPVYVHGSGTAFPIAGGMKPGSRISVFIGRPMMPGDIISRKKFEKKDYEAVAGTAMEGIARLQKKAKGLHQ
jgi:1-acyl-sn-glycerol-3-phosphate acyltransferase